MQHPFAAGGRGACRHHRGPALSGGHMCTCGRDVHDTATKCSTPTRHRTQCRAQPPMPAKTARGSSKARPRGRSGPCRMVATRRASNAVARERAAIENDAADAAHTHTSESQEVQPTQKERGRSEAMEGRLHVCVRGSPRMCERKRIDSLLRSVSNFPCYALGGSTLEVHVATCGSWSDQL